MKKQLLLIGITVVLIAVGLSGCTDKQQVDISSLDYSNSQYGFGFNPPEGWIVRNESGGIPSYQAPIESNYPTLISINSLVLESGQTLDDLTNELVELLPNIYTNFSLISENQRIINGMTANEIVITYVVPYINESQIKQVYIAKNTKLLLVQYSATSETYDTYLPDFEESLESVVMV